MGRPLDLKIPPVVIGALVAALQWGAGIWLPIGRMDWPGLPVVAFLFAAVGALIALSGVWSFQRASTTVNPHRPSKTSALVTGGVYRFTRNPMYLGMGCVLLAWSIYLGQAGSLLPLPLFFWYLTVFQIKPEEARLGELFPDTFPAYCAKTRRWL